MNEEQYQKAKELRERISTLKYKLKCLEKKLHIEYGNVRYDEEYVGRETQTIIVAILRSAVESKLKVAEKELEEL